MTWTWHNTTLNMIHYQQIWYNMFPGLIKSVNTTHQEKKNENEKKKTSCSYSKFCIYRSSGFLLHPSQGLLLPITSFSKAQISTRNFSSFFAKLKIFAFWSYIFPSLMPPAIMHAKFDWEVTSFDQSMLPQLPHHPIYYV